jgi:leucyl-tRNA synthetase
MSIVFEAPAPEAKAAVEITEAETTPKTPLQELEAEVRAGLHESSPKSDAELKALEHLYKIGSLIHDSNKNKMEAEDAYSTASAKIQARSGEIKFPQELGLNFEVFTTRIDTVYGMTFCVLAPEHPLVLEIEKFVSDERREAIRNYQAEAKLLSDVDRAATNREKTGVFTGAYAVNPFNEERVPIWLADYVLATYGTGAIMAVPGHDDRDFEFAQKFELPVRKVIQHPDETADASPEDFPLPFATKDGTMVNSGPYTGYSVQAGQTKLGEWLEERGLGKRVIQYKLRDWLISRQRYWGCPIPILHKADGEMVPVPEEDLPVLLPPVENYEPTDDGKSPLSRIPEFLNTTAPDGMAALRETDTMGGFACSSWYFLRFADPFNENQAWDPGKTDYWMPVDCYVGGAEHAVMHLLYARFWTKVFYDAGLVKVREPFARLENQGQVLGLTPYRKPRADERLDLGEEGILISQEEAKKLPEDQVMWRWVRMSKSKGNVVTPDEAVEEYGADALRLFLLFVAPFSADVEWDNRGMEGTSRFLSRVFKLVDENKGHYDPDWRHKIIAAEPDQHSKNVRRATHGTIKKASEDIEKFAFNTYISELMKYVNTLNDVIKAAGPSRSEPLTLALSEAMETLVLLLSPAAPHSADELWESLGKTGFTYQAEWPAFEPGLAVAETETIAVQVNGKLRDTIEIAAGSSEEETVAAAKGSTKVQGYLEGVTIRKTVYVKGRLVNFVVG